MTDNNPLAPTDRPPEPPPPANGPVAYAAPQQPAYPVPQPPAFAPQPPPFQVGYRAPRPSALAITSVVLLGLTAALYLARFIIELAYIGQEDFVEFGKSWPRPVMYLVIAVVMAIAAVLIGIGEGAGRALGGAAAGAAAWFGLDWLGALITAGEYGGLDTWDWWSWTHFAVSIAACVAGVVVIVLQMLPGIGDWYAARRDRRPPAPAWYPPPSAPPGPGQQPGPSSPG